MSLNLGGVTTELIGLALDAALLRHEVIANNIANHQTPGYQAKRVNFESYLSDIMTQLQHSSESSVRSRLDTVQSYLQDGSTMIVPEEDTVELDREMVRLTKNTLRYQAIVKAGSERGELIRLAINGGKQ